jgi:hypothetical protein
VLPAIYIAFALFVEWALLTHKAGRSLAGLSIVAVGVPVFFLWRQRAVKSDGQKSEVRSQKSEVRSQESGDRR